MEVISRARSLSQKNTAGPSYANDICNIRVKHPSPSERCWGEVLKSSLFYSTAQSYFRNPN